MRDGLRLFGGPHHERTRPMPAGAKLDDIIDVDGEAYRILVMDEVHHEPVGWAVHSGVPTEAFLEWARSEGLVTMERD